MPGMTVKEFAQSRNVEPGTVYVYISRHPEIREHTIKTGQVTELDEVAVQRLSEQYPAPKPVYVVNGVPQEEHDELRAKYDELLQRYASAQEQMTGIQTERLEERKKLVEAETRLQLLEDRSQEAREKEKQLIEDKAQADRDVLALRKQAEEEKAAREAAEAARTEAEEELQRIRSRGLWARIWNV